MAAKVRNRKGMYRYLTFGLLTLLFTISMAVTAFGGQYEDATAAYKRGDYEEAYRLIKPLAEQGYAKAQYNLALTYEYGRGVPQDYAEAVKWYRGAAEQELPEAQIILGFMYYKGRGVPQDYAEAVKWYRRAAEQGHPDAQNNIASKFYKGQGVPQNYILAHMWFNIAASRIPALEKEKRNVVVNNRDLVASEMTPAQIAEAERLAREWKPKKEGK